VPLRSRGRTREKQRACPNDDACRCSGVGLYFQLALAAGARSLGGTHIRLPTSLRVGSIVSILTYGLGALVVLRRAGLPIRLDFTGGCTSRNLGFSRQSDALSVDQPSFHEVHWEQFLTGPTALLLAVSSRDCCAQRNRTVSTSSAESEDLAS